MLLKRGDTDAAYSIQKKFVLPALIEIDLENLSDDAGHFVFGYGRPQTLT